MRKSKVYFGRNKRVTQFGKVANTQVWGVPVMLRHYFTVQTKRYLDIQQMKLNINGSYGSMGQRPAVDPGKMEQLLNERRQLKQKFMSGNF